MFTKEEIASILKKLRTASGKTQKEVAEALGRKQQVIGHWETGYSQPDADTLFVLCEMYGTTVDDAFGFNRIKKYEVTESEYDHVKKYRQLNDEGQRRCDENLDDLLAIPKYKKSYAVVETGNEKDAAV